MSKIVRTVEIDAPPASVWSVIVDVERWPEWSPGTRSIKRRDSGALALASRARITMKGTRGSIWQVTEFDEGRSFTWETDIMPGAHVIAIHEVEPRDGGSVVTLTLETRGPAAAIFAPLLDPFSRRNVEREAAGLKARCEAAALGAS